MRRSASSAVMRPASLSFRFHSFCRRILRQLGFTIPPPRRGPVLPIPFLLHYTFSGRRRWSARLRGVCFLFHSFYTARIAAWLGADVDYFRFHSFHRTHSQHVALVADLCASPSNSIPSTDTSLGSRRGSARMSTTSDSIPSTRRILRRLSATETLCPSCFQFHSFYSRISQRRGVRQLETSASVADWSTRSSCWFLPIPFLQQTDRDLPDSIPSMARCRSIPASNSIPRCDLKWSLPIPFHVGAGGRPSSSIRSTDAFPASHSRPLARRRRSSSSIPSTDAFPAWSRSTSTTPDGSFQFHSFYRRISSIRTPLRRFGPAWLPIPFLLQTHQRTPASDKLASLQPSRFHSFDSDDHSSSVPVSSAHAHESPSLARHDQSSADSPSEDAPRFVPVLGSVS